MRLQAAEYSKKTFRLQIAKREDGYSVGLMKMRNWILWGGRPPPKRKRNTAHREEVGNV
jgi:hypothetical protein